MKPFKKEFKNLYNKYSKKLLACHKNNLEVINLDYFIVYLKFIRDYYILTEPLVTESGAENLKIASLATAIAEYEEYQNCIHKYYNQHGMPILEGTKEEIQYKYNIEKAFHWNSF